MGDNPQEEEHLPLKPLEAGMRGNSLESSNFHPSHQLTPQGQVDDECTRAQPLNNIGKAGARLTCSYEDNNCQKKAKLVARSHASPNLVSPFAQMLELQRMSYGHAFSSLDLHSQCSFNMPQFRSASSNPEDAHSAPYVPLCTPAGPGENLLQSSSLLGFCHQNNHERVSLADSSRVTVLYAELIRELERQMGELRRMLASQEEVAARQEKRIQELELENHKLKGLLWHLEEQNDFLSIRNGAGGTAPARMVLGTAPDRFDVNESNIQFLKSLVGMLENFTATQVSGRSSPSSPEDQSHTPVPSPNTSYSWSSRNTVPTGLSPWINAEGRSRSPTGLSSATSLWSSRQEKLSDGTPVWASPVEENGRVKLELVPNARVYITHHQLEDLSQVSADKPELMTRRLLDYFFSRETLARSSATGQRIAHNNLTMEKPSPLPVAVVNAIKGRGWECRK
uniref:BEN domain-containing protein n=1 Tax=Varanus komodoensis TaxID=61221 RepID=A0A8D2KRQ4_VARKO